jgi:methyl-accepting chemotaxis protein
MTCKFVQATELLGKKFTLEEVVEFTDLIAEKLNTAIDKVDNINHKTHVLSVNASIEAARAGTSGRPFGIVATTCQSSLRKPQRLQKK